MTTNVLVPPSNGGGLSGDRVPTWDRRTVDRDYGLVDRDGLPLPDTMLVIGYTTVLQRWKDKKPETSPNTRFPIRSTQRRDPSGGMGDRPGRQANAAVEAHLRDLHDRPGKTGGLFTYAHSTYGAMLAYKNLEEAIGVMRMLRGEHVLPIVHLEKRR